MVVLAWPRALTSNLFLTIVLNTTPETICMLVTEVREYKMKSVLSLDEKNKIMSNGRVVVTFKEIPGDAGIA